MSWSSKSAWWNLHAKISAWWSWRENSGYIRQISIWISSFDNWETAYCSSNSIAVFTWLHLLQIVSFVLDSASIDRRFTRKRKEYARAILPFLHVAERDIWHHLVTGNESYFFEYITTSHVDSVEKWYGHKTEIWYSEQRIHIYNHMESEWFLCCRQIAKWCQNEQRLFCDKSIYSIYYTRTNDCSSKKGAASKTIGSLFRQLLSSHKSSFNRLAWRAWHSPHATPIHPIHLIWPLMISTCFLQSKKNLNGFRWLTKNSFWVSARDFKGSGSKRIK
jgi:hypothetical protein